MMKQLFVICALVAVVLTAPAPKQEETRLLNYTNDNNGLGPYSFSYQTSDGASRTENAQILNPGDPTKESIVVTGQYSYVAPDGITYTYNYIADHNGYRVNRVL